MAEQQYEWWVVVDETGLPAFITIDRQMAQDHINDALQEHGIKEAAKWVVRRAYAAPQQREPLTKEKLYELLTLIDPETRRLPPGFVEFARAIEAAHGIGGKK